MGRGLRGGDPRGLCQGEKNWNKKLDFNWNKVRKIGTPLTLKYKGSNKFMNRSDVFFFPLGNSLYSCSASLQIYLKPIQTAVEAPVLDLMDKRKS
jgi:hypothetical protein